MTTLPDYTMTPEQQLHVEGQRYVFARDRSGFSPEVVEYAVRVLGPRMSDKSRERRRDKRPAVA